MRILNLIFLSIINRLIKKIEFFNFPRGTFKFRKILLKLSVIYQKRINIDDLNNHFKQLISKSTLIFDIGSNIGIYTSIFLKYSSKVISVEPQESLCLLQKKLFKEEILNDRLIIEHIAIDSKNKIVELHINSKDLLSSTSKKYQTEVIPKEFSFTENIKTEAVQAKNIDSLILKYGKPNYIKIDIEGSEEKAIMGLNHQIPLISFECNIPYFKKEMFEILKKLSTLGKYEYNFLKHKEFVFNSDLKSGNEIRSLVQNGSLSGVFDLYCFSSDYSLLTTGLYSTIFYK